MCATDITASAPQFLSDAAKASSARPGAPVKAAVQSVNPARQADWDALLARQPRGSFFQSAAWASVLSETYGFEPNYLTVQADGALQSLLPLMEVNSWLTGRRGVSLPFTDDCDPIYADADSFKAVFDTATELGRERSWKYLELRGGRKLFADTPASVAFYGHELDLTGVEEQLFDRVDSSVRRAIRKAEKAGVTVEVSDSEGSLRTFYSLFCPTRKKHGMPPQPYAFFQNIHKHILSKKLGVVVIARFAGRPIAAGVYFRFGPRAIYKYGASDESQQNLRGNNLVMWEAIKWHARQGCQSLHLGRTSLTNEGLRRFKLGWGAAEQPIEYLKYDLGEKRFITDRDEASGWHNQIFHRMPICISRVIGAGLYRHWA